MEDVLDLYHEERDPEWPVVCFDETSKQLIEDVRPPIEAAPGRVERYDTEYKRNGTRNLFVFCEPKGGWRHIEVTERRTALDFAHQMKWLVDEAYPDAKTIRLVLDNLNTHKLGSLYSLKTSSSVARLILAMMAAIPRPTAIAGGKVIWRLRHGSSHKWTSVMGGRHVKKITVMSMKPRPSQKLGAARKNVTVKRDM